MTKSYILIFEVLVPFNQARQEVFPLQLVAESKYGYKWIKWITKMELSDNVNYKGYWESYGYPNDAAVP